jgi:hypothetical protein
MNYVLTKKQNTSRKIWIKMDMKGESIMSVLKKTALITTFMLTIVLIVTGCNFPTSGETPTPTIAEIPEEGSSPSEAAEDQLEVATEAPESPPESTGLTYPIVDTNQTFCFNDAVGILCPEVGDAYFGQDAQYVGNQPDYTDNGDGTITDLNTGLMWTKEPGLNLTYSQAVAAVVTFNLAGHNDWRLPTIKELYSLILFSGYDPSGCDSEAACLNLVPFIDVNLFDFQYGQTDAGERLIDAQFISSTPYVGQGLEGGLVFGVNFADGRIKGYGTGPMPGTTGDKLFRVLYVRGETEYGLNQFVDNGDDTISDQATGLTWMQGDSQDTLGWGDALAYCEDLSLAGKDDWRLPNAKELHSIIDLTRSPDTTDSAAINTLFQSTSITNEAGQPDYGYYWTSTTHLNRQTGGTDAVYFAFGRALGYMDGTWTDVHGAGAQRSDPKVGDAVNFSQGRGPQGDAIRILNYARCVRGGVSAEILTGGEVDPNATGDQVIPGVDPDQGEPPEKPPKEALEACEGKTVNTACQYQGVFGLRDGVCNELFGQLVCMPGVVLPTLPSP